MSQLFAQVYLDEDASARQRKHAGIIIAVRRMPHDLLNRVLSLLNQSTADEIADNVWYL